MVELVESVQLDEGCSQEVSDSVASEDGSQNYGGRESDDTIYGDGDLGDGGAGDGGAGGYAGGDTGNDA